MHPAQACRFGQVDAFGQLTVGDAAVELQGPDNGAIVAIQFHDRPLRYRQFLA
jgi:hypothetical protein